LKWNTKKKAPKNSFRLIKKTKKWEGFSKPRIKAKPGKKWYSTSSGWPSKVLNWLKGLNYLHWFLACVSGALAGCSLPGSIDNKFMAFNGLLAWFALVPLFVVLWLSKNIWQAVFKAFLAGFCFNLIGFRLLLGIHPLTWLGVPEGLSIIASWTALFIPAFLGAAYWALYGVLFKLLQGVLGVNEWTAMHGAIIWVVWQEKIVGSLKLGGLPWTSLYYSQHANTYLIQIAEWLGGSVISFMLVFANINLAYWLIMRNVKDGQAGVNWGGEARRFANAVSMSVQGLSLIFVFLAYGIWTSELAPQASTRLPSIKVLLLQKNLPAAQTRFQGLNSGANAEAYLKLFKKVHSSGNPNLVILPEGSLKQNQFAGFTNEVQAVSPITSIISGSYFSDTGASYNAALALSSGALISFSKKFCPIEAGKKQTQQQYLKQALVPFGEYTPFEDFFSRILKNFDLETLAESSFKASKESQSFSFNFGSVSPLICFELIYPELVSKQVKKGGSAIVLTGDASWFHKKKNLVGGQMLAIAKFRAIENRRETVLDINDGPLAVVDRFGRIKTSTADSEFTFANLGLNGQLSGFTRNLW
jgi:apolipoprotein N-acyltransferase